MREQQGLRPFPLSTLSGAVGEKIDIIRCRRGVSGWHGAIKQSKSVGNGWYGKMTVMVSFREVDQIRFECPMPQLGRGSSAARLHSQRLDGRRLSKRAASAATAARSPAMIICQCRNISDHDINAVVDWMRASDPGAVITPGKIYRVLGQSAECGSCMPLVTAVMSLNENLPVALDRSGSRNRTTKEQKL